MFYIALFCLIVLGLIALAILVLNLGVLLNGVHLNLLISHPGIPVLLLCLVSVFLGALLLYVVSALAARHDAWKIKELSRRIEELEQAQVKTPTGGLPGVSFVSPAVPIPGFASSAPLQPGPFPSGPSGQRPPAGSLSSLSPSASGLGNMSFPAKQSQALPPVQPSPPGSSYPPFFQP